MAGAGYREFMVNEVLTASNVQSYLMDQAEMVFSTTANRDSSITTPTNGMTAYTTDAGILWRYNGAAWKAWGKAPTAYTPTLTNATRTSGDLYYSISAGMMTIVGRVIVSAVTGSLTFSIPSGYTIDTAAVPAQNGNGFLVDTGVGNYLGFPVVASTTTVAIQAVVTSGAYAVAGATTSTVPFTWGAGDAFSITVTLPLA